MMRGLYAVCKGFIVLFFILIVSLPVLAEEVIHVVQPGDSLYRISLRYGISVEEIASANEISNTWRIDVGDEILIPDLTVPDDSLDVVNPLVAAPPQIHVVQFGETLDTIALRYDVSIDQILRANNIANPHMIFAGNELQIWTADPVEEDVSLAEIEATAPPSEIAVVESAVAVPEADEEAVNSDSELASGLAQPEDNFEVYVMQPGDTLSEIGESYDVSWREIAAYNGITSVTRVFAGTELLIPLAIEEDTVVDVAADTEGTDENELITNGDTTEITEESSDIIVVDAEVQSVELTDASEADDLLASINGDDDTEVTEIGDEAIEPTEEEIETKTHVIKAGETLSLISQRYGILMADIMNMNGISNPNAISAGDELIIPLLTYDQTTVLHVPEIDPGAHLGYGREIVVDLSDSSVYAYEDGELVYSALASTGLPATPTVKGDFKVYHKYPSQTMSGPGYYLPGVESVMYFFHGYAIHGTYWHNNFGQPMSHGCVNLPNDQAAWFYNFAEVGTPVHVQA